MRKIRTFVIVLLTVFTVVKSYAGTNVPLCLGQDATICAGQTVTISNCNSGSNTSNASGVYLNAPSSVTLSDDAWSGVVNLGFTFNFYGQNYTQCVIGSNGLVSFNTNQANGYCPWSLTGGPLPNTTITGARNSAMITYQDINPSLGGQIQYQSIGTAPNRKFVVLYKNILMFSCTSQCNYMAIILYETSNIVEYHIGNKPQCTTWNSGLAIQGTENNAMTVAHTTPGRNNTVWGANQDGRRYTPTSPTNTNAYTITQIPYVMVNSPGSNFVWNACNAAGTILATFPYNNGVLNLPSTNPNFAIPAGTSGYFLSGNACGTSIGSITNDTTWITVTNPVVTASSTPDICTQGLGSLTATPGAASQAPYTFQWSPGGANTQIVNNVLAGNYTVTMTDANGCLATATTTVGDTPAQFTATTTLVSCSGGTNGTATATMTPPLGTITYQWSDALNQTTQTATNLAAGTYTCTVTASIGCSGIVTATVSQIPGMTLNVANQTDVTCNSGSDGTATITASQGTSPYTYNWDQSTSTTNSANDLSAGIHTLTVTDNLGCTESISMTIGEPDPLSISSIISDSMICPGTFITLNAVGAGGSSPYIYTWTEGTNQAGAGGNVTVRPNVSGTVYCLTLTEQCGSPQVQECVTITFPVDINPNVSPNKPKDCVPGEFVFTNTSANLGEIGFTQYAFSNGEVYNVVGSEDLIATFPSVGVYSVQMTVTSNYGCIYTSYIGNVVEVTPLPVADFTISKNPATWFETNIQTSDISTGNISNWNWQSLGAVSINNAGSSALLSYPEGQVGTYPITLTVTTAEGCSDSITLEIEIVPDVILYVPNAFTPDDDEHNQTWGINIDGIDFENFQLVLYNRWGELIWESKDARQSWDGTYNGRIVSNGTYIWKISFKEKDNDGKRFFTGFVNVLR
jgi:gliding motility-associated-like protein